MCFILMKQKQTFCVSVQLDQNLATLVSLPLEKDYFKKMQPDPLQDI